MSPSFFWTVLQLCSKIETNIFSTTTIPTRSEFMYNYEKQSSVGFIFPSPPQSCDYWQKFDKNQYRAVPFYLTGGAHRKKFFALYRISLAAVKRRERIFDSNVWELMVHPLC